MKFKAVKIQKGAGGWGGPLIIKPEEGKDKIASVTGGGIDPVAQRIAELTGGTAFDGFKSSVPEDEICCVVIDCGGTARCGVYPRKRIPTINLTPVGQVGPLAQYIKEDIYVSGVKPDNISIISSQDAEHIRPDISAESDVLEDNVITNAESRKVGIIEKIGRGMGGVVSIFYQSGRETIDQVIKNILPFIAFVATLIGIILKSGIGNWIANIISFSRKLAWSVSHFNCMCNHTFTFIRAGAVIAQVVGVLVGVEIGKGNIPPQFALPALFAINPRSDVTLFPWD